MNEVAPHELPVALTIATSDSGAGAGVQADLLTFAARRVFGTTVFVALTAQNPDGVSDIATLEADFIRSQFAQVADYFDVGAIKLGMLFNAEIIEVVADLLAAKPSIPVVLDPVMVATSGAVLLQPDAVASLRTRLLPRATVITPNLDEMGVLRGEVPTTVEAMEEAGKALATESGAAVVVKGGHLDATTLTDLLVMPDGTVERFTHPRIPGVNTHGSGCTLSSAIAAELAKGRPLNEAVAAALNYLHGALTSPLRVAGEAFIGH